MQEPRLEAGEWAGPRVLERASVMAPEWAWVQALELARESGKIRAWEWVLERDPQRAK